MKSEKAKEVLARSYDGGHICMENAERAIELAEQEAEERMRRKAVEIFDQTIRAVLFIEEKDLARYKDMFIYKLNKK